MHHNTPSLKFKLFYLCNRSTNLSKLLTKFLFWIFKPYLQDFYFWPGHWNMWPKWILQWCFLFLWRQEQPLFQLWCSFASYQQVFHYNSTKIGKGRASCGFEPGVVLGRTQHLWKDPNNRMSNAKLSIPAHSFIYTWPELLTSNQ